MRLVEKYVKLHPDTFAPEMVVTVALPMELAPEIPDPAKAEALTDLIFEKMGKDFIEIIKTAKMTK